MGTDTNQIEVPTGRTVPAECPFCGAFFARLLEFAPGAYYVRCRKCSGCGPLGPTRDSAAHAWNTRPMVELLRSVVENDTESLVKQWLEEGPESPYQV